MRVLQQVDMHCRYGKCIETMPGRTNDLLVALQGPHKTPGDRNQAAVENDAETREVLKQEFEKIKREMKAAEKDAAREDTMVKRM